MFKKAFWFLSIIGLLLVIFLPGYTKLQELREKNRDLTQKVKELNIDNKRLQQELKQIENDPIYQEKIAREKMGVVRKGEVLFKIVPEAKE